jgi:hypothetical protein
MEITEVLLTMAQAALVIAGFGGVVITLHDRSEIWGEWDRIQFRSILDVSGIIIFFSLLPLALQSVLDVATAWRVSIILFAIVHSATIISYRVTVDRQSIPPIFNRIHIVASLVIISQFAVGVTGHQGFIQISHLSGLFWLVAVGGWLFYLLALGVPEAGADD